MKLNTVDIARLLPFFMREDKIFKGICYALEDEIKQLHEQTDLIKLYINIDTLPEEVLDELAWQFNAIEYNKSYSIDIKRNLIKNCMNTHHRRGTVAAVEDIAASIFGNATVTEWFEYGGEPFHFKVYTENVSTSDEMITEFNRVIRQTQNIRSHLEEVVAETMNSMDLYFGGFLQVNDDISMEVADLGEYDISNIELCVIDGKLGYNKVVIQEQNLAFTDISTGETYIVIYNEGLIVEAGEVEDPQDYLELIDFSTNKTYKVFIDNGKLYYEEIV